MKTIAGFAVLTWLDLHETAVGDGGLAALKGLAELRTLNLFKTAVTDGGLAALEGLGKLEDVYLRETKVTEAGITHLGGSSPRRRSPIRSPTADPGGLGKRKKKK